MLDLLKRQFYNLNVDDDLKEYIKKTDDINKIREYIINNGYNNNLEIFNINEPKVVKKYCTFDTRFCTNSNQGIFSWDIFYKGGNVSTGAKTIEPLTNVIIIEVNGFTIDYVENQYPILAPDDNLTNLDWFLYIENIKSPNYVFNVSQNKFHFRFVRNAFKIFSNYAANVYSLQQWFNTNLIPNTNYYYFNFPVNNITSLSLSLFDINNVKYTNNYIVELTFHCLVI